MKCFNASTAYLKVLYGKAGKKLRSRGGFGMAEILGIAAVLIVAAFVLIPGFRAFANSMVVSLNDWYEGTVQTRLFPTI